MRRAYAMHMLPPSLSRGLQTLFWLTVLALLLSCTAPAPAQQGGGLQPGAEGAFGAPVPVQILGYGNAVTSDNAASDEASLRDVMEPFLTRDGKYLFFNNSNDPSVDTNLHFARRIDDVTFAYVGEVPGVNTTQLEGTPTVDAQGTLYFVSPRSYRRSLSTVYRARWQGASAEIGLVPGISERVPGIVNFDVEVSADGNELIYVAGEFQRGETRPRSADLLHAYRQGDAFVRDPRGAQIFAAVNTAALEYAAALSSDGLELFFTRVDERQRPRQGPGMGAQPAIYRATRVDKAAPFSAAVRIAAAGSEAEGPALSSDGRTLYFHRRSRDGFALFCIQRDQPEQNTKYTAAMMHGPARR